MRWRMEARRRLSWNKEEPVATSTGSGVLRRGEEHPNLARGSWGWLIGCLHDAAREGADGHGDGEEQREEKRRGRRQVTVATGRIFIFLKNTKLVQQMNELI